MLKLNNVSKTYLSNGKQKVEALKDVNLEIKDSGLVFILGKSGSGKSTLLNILGGIDNATSGEVFIDGQSFADFKQADYDYYRNGYVGFVFQEFNLLNDFDVAGNVALALRLSGEKEISDKVTNALQSVGLSSDYLTRKVDELSGGEKQRVAIARAIVKDSRIILADEPTGNLDSATGESIWNILKNLSKSKLVIVVTHDRESAEKYGDRIIEISDGRVLSDSGEQPASKEQPPAFSPKKKSLSNSVCFKMGVNNLAQRKVKSVSVILLAIFTIFVILLTQVLLCYSPEKTLAKFINDNEIDYIRITQGTLRHGSRIQSDVYMREATSKYIEENTTYIKNTFVKGKQDILDMGLTFIGDALELDDTSVYLTTLGLEEAYRLYYVEVDGKIEKLNTSWHPADSLAGKKIYHKIFSDDDPTYYYTVGGVVDFTNYHPLSEELFNMRYYKYFAKESCTFREEEITQCNWNARPDVVLKFGETNYSSEFYVRDHVERFGFGKVLTEQGLKSYDEVALADDEILLSFEAYAGFFSAGSKLSYVSSDLNTVYDVPSHLGERRPFKIYDFESGDLILDLGELKLAGIAFSYSTIPDDSGKLTAGINTVNKMHAALNRQYYLVKVASIDNLQKFLVDFRKQYTGYVSYAGEEYVNGVWYKTHSYSDFVYNFESSAHLFKIIFVSTATLLSLILLLLAMNLISFSILNRKKEIGILSALGATNKDLTKIFLIETLLIAAVTFAINFAAIFVAVVILNNVFGAAYALNIPLLLVDIFTFITLIAASFGLLLLAALIPIKKIIKLKPVDAIKNL